MAVRELRRTGEKWFELMERTTHPDASMHVITGACDCLHHFEPRDYPAHATTPHVRKEQP